MGEYSHIISGSDDLAEAIRKVCDEQSERHKDLIKELTKEPIDMSHDTDDVNHPSHYNQGDIECIDAMRSALPKDQFIGYLRGCAMKYLWRLGQKGDPTKDAKKARWYLERLIEESENNDGENPGMG